MESSAREASANGWASTAATLATAAAGLGLFLAVLGSAIVWIRLAAEGLPADHGLAVVPKADLVALGFRKVLIPAGVAAVGLVLALRHLAEREARKAQGADAPDRWWRRLWRWLRAPSRPMRWLYTLLLLPLLPMFWFIGLLNRAGLGWLWFVIIFPFSWFFMTLAAANAVAERAYQAIFSGGPPSAREWQLMRWKAAGVAALAVAVPTLVGELDRPTQLQQVAVRTTDGHLMRGDYVASVGQGVFIGTSEDEIVEVPRSRILRVRVSKPPRRTPPDSLFQRGVEAVVGQL